MEFNSPYLHAMRARAPKMFGELRQNGTLEKHLQEKSEEAHRMFRDLTADAPKLPTARRRCRTGGKPRSRYSRR